MLDELIDHEQIAKLNYLITAEVDGVYQPIVDDAFYFGAADVDRPNVFWRYRIIQRNIENGKFYFHGIYELFDDLKSRTIIEDKRPQNAGAGVALAQLLDNTGWSVGTVNTNKQATTNWYFDTPLNAFWDFLEKWRVEFRPRMVYQNGKVVGKYIDLYDKISGDYGKWYEHGDNLLSVVEEQRNDEIYTAFHGRGKGEETGDGWGRRINFKDVVWSKQKGDPLDKPKGDGFLEFPQATTEYGYENDAPRHTPIIFDDIEDEHELIQATYEYGLNEIRPKVQYKTDVLENDNIDLGETVTIIRDDIGIRYKTRVFELRRNFLDKGIKEVQFGDKLAKSRAESTKNIKDSIKKQEEQTVDWLNVIRDTIINDYFNENGYDYDLKIGNAYDLPAGRYSFDRPIDKDPTKAVYMGAGKILLANDKDSAGDWLWQTAMDGDGIVADVINVGTLNANLIKAGVLMDRNGKFYLDMNTGQLIMKDGTFEGVVEALTGHIADWTIDGARMYRQHGDTGLYSVFKGGGSVMLATGVPDGTSGSTSGAELQIRHDGSINFHRKGSGWTGRIYKDGGRSRINVEYLDTDRISLPRMDIYNSSGNNAKIASTGTLMIEPGATTRHAGDFRPMSNNNYHLGGADYRWTRVWTVDGVSESSDVRLKSSIANIPDELLDAIGKVEPKMYEMNGKTKFGYVAQDVERELFKYACKLMDREVAKEYMKQFDVLDTNDDSYKALIYSQMEVLKGAYQDKRIEELEERLDRLEKRSE